MKIKKDRRALYIRLWIFQKERAPLYALIGMASLTAGIVFNFSTASVYNYLMSIAIIILYLVQIRTSDEKKDFEHDNKFHKNRPVQRGVVTLQELYVINVFAIVLQIALYASFFDARIFFIGLVSQLYAFLTRKEFFVREWIRKQFFIYYFLHYIQLVILFLGSILILNPVRVSHGALSCFFMLNIVASEMGRKMFPAQDDIADDSYSSQLGYKGSALALSALSLIIAVLAFYFIHTNLQNYIFLLLPILATLFTLYSAYKYGSNPNRAHAKRVELAGMMIYTASMLAVILGA